MTPEDARRIFELLPEEVKLRLRRANPYNAIAGVGDSVEIQVIRGGTVIQGKGADDGES